MIDNDQMRADSFKLFEIMIRLCAPRCGVQQLLVSELIKHVCWRIDNKKRV